MVHVLSDHDRTVYVMGRESMAMPGRGIAVRSTDAQTDEQAGARATRMMSPVMGVTRLGMVSTMPCVALVPHVAWLVYTTVMLDAVPTLILRACQGWGGRMHEENKAGK